jgi:hypothetical protein
METGQKHRTREEQHAHSACQLERALRAGENMPTGTGRSSSKSAAGADVTASGADLPVRERGAGQSLEKLTAADLEPSKIDHGHEWGRFDISDEVIVFFTVLALSGIITSKSKRSQSFTIELHPFGQHKVTSTRNVTVSHRCIEPIDAFTMLDDDMD